MFCSKKDERQFLASLTDSIPRKALRWDLNIDILAAVGKTIDPPTLQLRRSWVLTIVTCLTENCLCARKNTGIYSRKALNVIKDFAKYLGTKQGNLKIVTAKLSQTKAVDCKPCYGLFQCYHKGNYRIRKKLEFWHRMVTLRLCNNSSLNLTLF